MVYLVHYYRKARDWRAALSGKKLSTDIDDHPFDSVEFDSLEMALKAPMLNGAGFASLHDGFDADSTHYVRNVGEEWGIIPSD